MYLYIYINNVYRERERRPRPRPCQQAWGALARTKRKGQTRLLLLRRPSCARPASPAVIRIALLLSIKRAVQGNALQQIPCAVTAHQELVGCSWLLRFSNVAKVGLSCRMRGSTSHRAACRYCVAEVGKGAVRLLLMRKNAAKQNGQAAGGPYVSSRCSQLHEDFL